MTTNNLEKLTIKEFRGLSQKVHDIDAPIVYADTCKDFVMTYIGKLVKRNGYEGAQLNGVDFVSTGLSGNILNIFEFVTGRDETSAPNEAKKYFALTDSGNGKIYLWDESVPSWSQVDNNLSNFDGEYVRFFSVGNTLRVSGTGAADSYVLMWRYIDDRFVTAYSSTDATLRQIDGSFMTSMVKASASRPDINDFIYKIWSVYDDNQDEWLSYTHEGDGTLSEIYRYKISVQYDYIEWSMPSDDYLVGAGSAAPGYRARQQIILALFQTTYQNTYGKRVTGIRIFRSATNPNELSKYYLLKEISVDASPKDHFIKDMAASYVTGTGAVTIPLLAPAQDPGDMYIGTGGIPGNALKNMIAVLTCDEGTYTCMIQSSDNASISFTVDSGLGTMTNLTVTVQEGWFYSANYYYYSFQDYVDNITGNQEMYANLGYGEDINIDCNYKYSTIIDDQLFVAGVSFDNVQYNNQIRYCMLNNDGNFAYDVFHPLNVTGMPFNINGLASIADRLFVFGKTRVSRGIIPSSNYLTWDFEKAFTDFGLMAERSLVSTGHGRIYFLSSDYDVKEFDGNTFKSIGRDIYDDLIGTSLSYLRNAVAEYYPKMKWYILKFQDGASSYKYLIYDTFYQTWYEFEYHITNSTTELNLGGFINTDDGDLLGFTTTGVYAMDSGGDDGGVDINPDWKSKPITSGVDFLHQLFSFTPTYKSDTAIDIDLYLDKDSSSTTINNTFSAKTTMGSLESSLPLGTSCRNFQFRVRINQSDLGLNSYFELGQLDFYFKRIVPRSS
jgi:hypothetical protein